MQGTDLVNTVSADGLAPNGARPSADKVLTAQTCFLSFCPRPSGIVVACVCMFVSVCVSITSLST